MAGVEWGKAKQAWSRARVDALTEMEELKVEKDAMLVLKSQIGCWEGMLRAIAA